MGAKQKEVKYEASIKLTEYLKTISGSIIECRYIDNCWNFVRVRTDRIHPNDLRTISGTVTILVYEYSIMASISFKIENISSL